jgi:hypothetical protein
MMQYRFLLEGSYHVSGRLVASENQRPQKHRCPACGKKSFVRFVDGNTRAYLPETYGKCDHESKCGYFTSPYQDGYVQQIWQDEQEEGAQLAPVPAVKLPEPPAPVYMPRSILQATLKDYEQNGFVENLLAHVPHPFPREQVEKVIALYYLGTVSKGYLKGGVTYPFIDNAQNVRVIQAKTFDRHNHTLKTGNIHSLLERHYKQHPPAWLKAYLQNQGFFTCLFGEHLLSKYPNHPVALVEAPKTAIYGTLYLGFPEMARSFIWLAAYNISSLSYARCKVLSERNVVLFPDLSKTGNAYKVWREKAAYFNSVFPKAHFSVSNLLEKYATDAERTAGGDLADFLIQQDWRTFRREEPTEEVAPIVSEKLAALMKRKPQLRKWVDCFDLVEEKRGR